MSDEFDEGFQINESFYVSIPNSFVDFFVFNWPTRFQLKVFFRFSINDDCTNIYNYFFFCFQINKVQFLL